MLRTVALMRGPGQHHGVRLPALWRAGRYRRRRGAVTSRPANEAQLSRELLTESVAATMIDPGYGRARTPAQTRLAPGLGP